jgi:TRAP-type C4-dicarboxylate transport system permease small subunit
MTDQTLKSTLRVWMNPATETLYQKYFDLQERLKGFESLHNKLTEEQKHIVEICRTYLGKVRSYLEIPMFNAKWPFFRRRHPHLMWELLHRVDENFILLTDADELHGRAIDVRASFDLNIKEEKIREEWIGDRGVFRDILDQVKKKDKNTMSANQYLIRDALRIVNEKMDCSYWQLSMNIMTSVLSGLFLALLLLVAWIWQPTNPIRDLGKGGFANTFVILIALGLMGAYLSNLMTKEDFLYVRGGPYFRCLLHNLFSKPVMSAFAAVFIYGLEKTKLIFSIGNQTTSAKLAEIITINVNQDYMGYAYAVLAIVSGFSADKVLRSMFDKVLKKLEEKAEKTKDTEKK